jgi:hypothetical protein
VAVGGHPARQLRHGLDPAALEEPRRAHAARREDVEDAVADPRDVEPVGVLGVEGQGDADAGYFSSPLITMPRVKNRWKTRKMTIGMIIVISVPAWMNAWFR